MSVSRWVGAICAGVLAAWTATPAVAGGQVALTFDDLPVHGPLPSGLTRTAVLQQIIDALRRAGASDAYGFINANGLEVEDRQDTEQALRAWRAAGLLLANHTYSHISLHETDVETYRENLIANEPVLESLMGQEDWRWFRYPFLHEGDTLEKRRAVRKLLAERGYRIAQVTVDFHDYAYNAPYVRCLEKGDLQAIARLKAKYLASVGEALGYSEATSKRIFGRNIKHVVLLHVGVFQPLVLPQMLELLAQRGYDIVSLPEAQSDPAYAIDPDLAMPYGMAFLHQISIQRQLPPMPSVYEGIAELETVCR